LANHDARQPAAGVTHPAEPNLSLRDWFVRNGPLLMLLAVGLLFLRLVLKVDVFDLWNGVKVALGLGVVIFIHELGHFAVAKWCDVHVETFSIGFGPALPGCKFKYGETTYMIALIPLGGYVKMVGESGESEEGDDDPRSFKNKPVWQRMAIISAGVTMNVLLAFVCFIIVFRGPGKKQNPGVVGMVVPGSPAWQAGVPAGAWIHRIGSVEDPYFSQLLPQVMLSTQGEKLPLVYSRPPYQEKPVRVDIEPTVEKNGTRPLIGVYPAEALKAARRRYYPGRDHPAQLGSAAARAEPPFEWEDVVVGCTDPDHRAKGKDPEKDWTELPPDQRDQGKQKDYFVFLDRMRRLAGETVTVRVRRKAGGEVSVVVPPSPHLTLGLAMQMGQIVGVRPTSPGMGWKDGDRPIAKDAEREGDVIEQVEVKDNAGKVVRFLFPRNEAKHPKKPGVVLDPARLHYGLTKWAARKAGDKLVTLKVKRRNTRGSSDQYKPVTLVKKWDGSQAWRYPGEAPSADGAPLSIPELGIAFEATTTVAGVDPAWSARHGQPLKEGDVIKQVRFYVLDKQGEPEPGSWADCSKTPEQGAHLFWLLQHADVPKIDVRVNKSDDAITLTARPDASWPRIERGLILTPDMRMQRADSMGEAVALGLEDTYDKITQIYKTLRSLFTGRISPRTLGGPVKIASVAFAIVGENFWEFVYFLGFISINLAVVNFLPIPILDGGHMVFLIYEKIRGKPASEQVRAGATIVGAVLILSLFLFVTFNDIFK
jgi:regulator of sigma E protease